MILEILGQGIFEYIGYVLGRAVAAVFLPHLRVEPLSGRKGAPKCKRTGFTYEQGTHRYLYAESIQALGAGLLGVLVVCALALVHFGLAT